MKRTQQEKAARRAAFQTMSPAKKLDHVVTYYKAPILLALAALLILSSVVHRHLTRREPLLYLGFINVAVGEDLEHALTEGFVKAVGAEPSKKEIYLYRGLYLSEDAAVENHEYAYASRMKLMGAVSAGKLDMVLMNREAYDMLSRSGYLLELPAESRVLSPYLTANEVILSDNTIEYQLGEAESHEVVTETVKNGIEVSQFPLFQLAGFSAPVYLGILANSSRLSLDISYINYLLSFSFDS